MGSDTPQKRRRKRRVWIAIVSTLVLAGCTVLVIRLVQPVETTDSGGGSVHPAVQSKDDTPPPAGDIGTFLTFHDTPLAFACRMSVDGRSGRDMSGNLHTNGVVVETGLQTRADLEEYPLQRRLAADSLMTSTWERVPSTYFQGGGVLEVHGNTRSRPFVVEADVECRGIVVRHGGCLVIRGATARVEFILVESGGLLHVTGTHSRPTEIVLTTPDYGQGPCPVIASQYSARVYYPGAHEDDRDFNNRPVGMNMFGNKVVAVGFNGGVYIEGAHDDVQRVYTGPWSASHAAQAITDERFFLSVGESSFARRGYAVTWCTLADTAGYGATQIVLDTPIDTVRRAWGAGAQVVVTCRTEAYTDSTNALGVTPTWFDWVDPVQRSANNAAITRMPQQDYGIEVATITGLADAGDGRTVATLARPLRFTHRSEYTRLTSRSGEETRVDTRVHVGLLTRPVCIRSDVNATSGVPRGSGANRESLPPPGPVDLADPSTWRGQRGTVVHFYEPPNIDQGGEVHIETLYPETDPFPAVSPVDDAGVRGCWTYGTEGLRGSNAIAGGHIMGLYGASLVVRNAELRRLGQPGNFGKIGRYPVHFHLFGYARSFQGYTGTGARREGVVEDCSIWSSLSRFVAIHGAHEVGVVNNVCFWSLASGIFTEDGTESNNTIEHNLVCGVHYCMPNQHFNPGDGRQIFGHVSSDTVLSSAVWLKSNNNACLRNVLCCSPSPVIGIWSVPQDIRKLRGPSSFCRGDKELGLPALGVTTNGTCWSPGSMVASGVCSPDGSVWYGTTNGTIPYFRLMDNVCYNMAGYWSEFPDSHFSPLESTGLHVCMRLVRDQTDFIEQWGWPSPREFEVTQYIHRYYARHLFFPSDTQNAGIDGKIGRSVYFVSQAHGGVDPSRLDSWFPPGSDARRQMYTETEDHTRTSPTFHLLPKVLTGSLTFNLGPVFGALNLGSGWAKQSGVVVANSCFLRTGGGDTIGIAAYDSSTSASFVFMVGDDRAPYRNVFHMYHNLITDGALGVPPNPTIFGGEWTFVSADYTLHLAEYTATQHTAACDFYYYDGCRDRLRLDQATVVASAVESRSWVHRPHTPDETHRARKYACLCGGEDDGFGLFRDQDGSIVSHTQFMGLFATPYAVELGDLWCRRFASIPFSV